MASPFPRFPRDYTRTSLIRSARERAPHLYNTALEAFRTYLFTNKPAMVDSLDQLVERDRALDQSASLTLTCMMLAFEAGRAYQAANPKAELNDPTLYASLQ